MKILIAIPCMSMMHTKFVKSLITMQLPADTKVMMTENSLVYDARNRMVVEALKGGYSHIFWLDSDMTFQPDILYRLVEDAEQYDYVTALCFARRLPTKPILCKSITWDQTDNGVIHEAVDMPDYPKDQLFEIAGSGSAACLVRTSLYEAVAERWKQAAYQPLQQLGEDYSFCWKLGQLGVKMACDSRIKVGHIGEIEVTEELYEGQQNG